MLIALDFPQGFRDHEMIAKELVKDVKGKTTIYMPKSIDDFVEKVKKYEPRKTQHLILLRSHFSFMSAASDAQWRATDLFFQSRGGAVWGEDPERENLTHVSRYDFNNTSRVIDEATYNAQQANAIRAHVKTYLGRTSVSPTTTFVGFNPTYPKQSRYSEFFMDSLPSDWWRGVSFVEKRVTPATESLLFALDETNIVSVGDEAHDRLLELNIEHGSVPGLRQIFNAKDSTVGVKYGRLLRETARTGDDNRSWRP